MCRLPEGRHVEDVHRHLAHAGAVGPNVYAVFRPPLGAGDAFRTLHPSGPAASNIIIKTYSAPFTTKEDCSALERQCVNA